MPLIGILLICTWTHPWIHILTVAALGLVQSYTPLSSKNLVVVRVLKEFLSSLVQSKGVVSIFQSSYKKIQSWVAKFNAMVCIHNEIVQALSDSI